MKVIAITATKGIYKITSPSNKVYIGQAINLKRRFRDYTYINRIKAQAKLYSSFLKYGVENHKFEIINEFPKDISQEVIDTYEQLYMDFYKDCKIELLNIKDAGKRGKMSEESKNKLRLIHTGKVLSEETKRKISENRKGKNTGKDNNMYGIGLIGDAKQRMIDSKTGTKLSEETKLKMSIAHRKRWKKEI